jgi:hypothetical protein
LGVVENRSRDEGSRNEIAVRLRVVTLYGAHEVVEQRPVLLRYLR